MADETYPKKECEHAIKEAVELIVKPIVLEQNKIKDRIFVDADKDSIQTSQLKMNGKLDEIESTIDKQWKLLVLILLSILGIAFGVIQTNMQNKDTNEKQEINTGIGDS